MDMAASEQGPLHDIDTASSVANESAPGATGRDHFTRQFAILAFVSIAIVSAGSAAFLSRHMAFETIRHDATEVMQFVQSFTPGAVAEPYFAGIDNPGAQAALSPLLERIAAMPDVVHMNVYDREHRVRWSTRPEMVGQTLPLNEELDEALEGELAVESSLLEERNYLKPEHIYLRDVSADFVETYVPIWQADRTRVIGVIEIYRQPRALMAMTRDLIRNVWTSALLGGVFLFFSLYWIAHRADRIIRSQQRQLVEAETMAAVGEMAAAVAHSIRNPLAAIRSSAELELETNDAASRPATEEIIVQVDRIAAWITQLLVYSQPTTPRRQRVNLTAVLAMTLADFQRELDKRGVTVVTDAPEDLPEVNGDPAVIGQVFTTLLSNAVDAMPSGGAVRIAATAQGARVQVTLSDTGVGISPEQLDRLFVPFHTTKKTGLGVGLPLVRRVLERMNGRIDVASAKGHGTTVSLSWQAA